MLSNGTQTACPTARVAGSYLHRPRPGTIDSTITIDSTLLYIPLCCISHSATGHWSNVVVQTSAWKELTAVTAATARS